MCGGVEGEASGGHEASEVSWFFWKLTQISFKMESRFESNQELKKSNFLHHRQRYAVEMLNMAQRPYSSVTLDVTADPKTPTESQNSPKSQRTKSDKSENFVPVAIETTSDNVAAVCTIFVRLPETKQKRRPVCMGSALISAPKQSIFLNKPAQRVAQHNM